MTAPRFLVLVATNPAAQATWEAKLPAQLGDFERIRIGSRTTVLSIASATTRLGSDGLIIGAIYDHGRARLAGSLDPDTIAKITGSLGDHLTHACWGSYVAVIATRDESLSVLRAPFGELAGLIIRTPFGTVIASDIALLEQFSHFRPRVDRARLARQLVVGDLYQRATCLADLDELTGGERVTDRGGCLTFDHAWNIWAYVNANVRVDDPAEAARLVRDAVQTSVTAAAAPHNTALLRLSGGLDSSVVGAALTRSGCRFLAQTMVTRDRAGDERRHARLVARKLDVKLVESLRLVDHVNLERSLAAGMPRPAARAFEQASLRCAIATAEGNGATAIFDGGGGDNMFAALQSPAPVADCLAADGGLGRFWQTASSIGRAAQTSTFEVARRALLRHWFRGPQYRWPRDITFLSDEARTLAGDVELHPWLTPPPGTLPGSAAHVALIAVAHSVVQSRPPLAPITVVSPLITQPVAMACLRVPSWRWTRDGRNRVAARDAFRGLLPPSVIDRRDKGAPDSFLIELIEARRPQIEAMLTRGMLADLGLVEPSAISQALQPARLARGRDYGRLMQLVDAEAWTRSWSSPI